jgi:hypothetical protein
MIKIEASRKFDFPHYKIWLVKEAFWAAGNYSTLEEAETALKHIDSKYSPIIMKYVEMNDKTHGYVDIRTYK